MAKPIQIQRDGRKWFVFDKTTPITVGTDGRMALPDRKNYDPNGKPFVFKTKDDAASIAHQLGKYIRKYGGDMVFAYTEVIDENGNELSL